MAYRYASPVSACGYAGLSACSQASPGSMLKLMATVRRPCSSWIPRQCGLYPSVDAGDLRPLDQIVEHMEDFIGDRKFDDLAVGINLKHGKQAKGGAFARYVQSSESSDPLQQVRLRFRRVGHPAGAARGSI